MKWILLAFACSTASMDDCTPVKVQGQSEFDTIEECMPHMRTTEEEGTMLVQLYNAKE